LLIATAQQDGNQVQDAAAIASEAFPTAGHDLDIFEPPILGIIDIKGTFAVPQIAAGYPYLCVLDTVNTFGEDIYYFAIADIPVYGISTEQSAGNTASWDNNNDEFFPGVLEFWPLHHENHAIDRQGPTMTARHYMTDQDKVGEGGHLCAAVGGKLVVFECDQIEGWE
jgi:hypothetical protein